MSQVNRVRRLLHLLERLQSGRAFNARELAEFCRVSRRTLFRDLSILQKSGVPVLYDAQKQGYWIAQSVFLPPTELSLDETLSLILLAQELGHSEHGLPFQQPAAQAGMKLVSNLPGNLREHVGELSGKVQVRVAQVARSNTVQEYYQLLVQALARQQKVRITYHSLFEQQDITTLLSPYRLLFLNRAWYVIGRSSLHRSTRTFHLGRILRAEPLAEKYEIPPRFSLDRFFGNAWRMIRHRAERARVRIRFAPKVARNVAEVTWHKTQEIRWNDDGSIDFLVTVDGLQEISWWIMGYGHQAEVLEPPQLRELIAEHVRQMAEQYGMEVAAPAPSADKPGTKRRKGT